MKKAESAVGFQLKEHRSQINGFMVDTLVSFSLLIFEIVIPAELLGTEYHGPFRGCRFHHLCHGGLFRSA